MSTYQEDREHAHRTRAARDACAAGRCDGDVRYDSEPFDPHVIVGPVAPGALVIGDLLTIHPDGRVEGRVEDMGEAAARFVQWLRDLLGYRMPGYRKPPSREALSEVLMSIYDHGTQPNALREADAVLALWKEEA